MKINKCDFVSHISDIFLGFRGIQRKMSELQDKNSEFRKKNENCKI